MDLECIKAFEIAVFNCYNIKESGNFRGVELK